MTEDEITQFRKLEAEGEKVKATIGTPGWAIIDDVLHCENRKALTLLIGLPLGPELVRNQEIIKAVNYLKDQIEAKIKAGDSAHEALEKEKNTDT